MSESGPGDVAENAEKSAENAGNSGQNAPARISREDVLHLADLVKIDLAEDEVDPLRGDLEAVLRYVRQLDEQDTAGVEPLDDAFGGGVLRPDEPGPTLTPADLAMLEGFEPQSGYFTVPAVFGDGGHA